MSDSSQDRTPRSAGLPGNAPSRTRRIVTTLADLAGPASSARLAGRLGVQLTGRVATELASAKQYGFIATDGSEKLIVTPRGEAFISDDQAASVRAAQDGVMNTSFAPIIKKLMTRQADASIVEVRFQEDQGITEGPAKNRAAILVKAAEEAQLIADGRFDAEAIEETIERVGDVSPDEGKAAPKPKAKPSATPKTTEAKPEAKTPNPHAETSKRETPKTEEGGGPFVPAPSMRVVLQIDASKLTADEIVTIANKLKEVGASTSAS
jgi:hypothetical protein